MMMNWTMKHMSSKGRDRHKTGHPRFIIWPPPLSFSFIFLSLSLLLLIKSSPTEGYSPTTTVKLCTYNQEHTAANCSNRNLDYVPWRVHKNINSLDLSNNNFSSVKSKSFTSYIYINQLYLRNNSMISVHKQAFLKLDYLRTLDLSNNKLAQIPTEALDVVSHSLEVLILAGNKLSHVNKDTFLHFKMLTHLDLSGNSIYVVQPSAFIGLYSLTVLKLRHNAIKSLPQNSFSSFPKDSMTEVQLYDNRWVCDCKLRWLWRWLNSTDSAVWDFPGYAIRCDGPAIITDESLDIVPLEKLACEVQMKTSGSTHEVNEGSSTSLLCKYATIPEAEAKWIKNTEQVDLSTLIATEQGGETGDITERKKNTAVKKYEVENSEKIDARGALTYMSQLTINDFRYEDIARYKCQIENIRGMAYTEYRLTLNDVDFESVVVYPPVGRKAEESGKVDIRTVIIAIAVVGGIILLIVIAVVIFCSVNRAQRKKQAKRDAIVEHVKEHFIKNSVDSPTGDYPENANKSSTLPRPNNMDPHQPIPLSVVGTPSTAHHSYRGGGQQQDDNRSNYTNESTYKAPIPLDNELEPMLISNSYSPGSPINGNPNHGNTYVSFGSEFTDPGDFPSHVLPVYQQHAPIHHHPLANNNNGAPPPNHYNNNYNHHSHNGVAPVLQQQHHQGVPVGSHDGSATPLLDRYTPVFLEDDDDLDGPIEEDYASYPVYDSVTNSLQHPVISSSQSHSPYPNNNMNTSMYSHPASDYGGSVGGGGKLYGTLPAHINGGGGGIDPTKRGYYGTNSNSNPHNRSLGSASSFHYPHSNHSQSGSSMPRTPGSVRSVNAAAPPSSSSSSTTNAPGNSSPPIILENHYQPPPMAHRPHPEYSNGNRDYDNRDNNNINNMGYSQPLHSSSSSTSSSHPHSQYHPSPYHHHPPNHNPNPVNITNSITPPPLNRDVNNARNIGGGYSPSPSSASSSGPRKPPRVYIPGAGPNGGDGECFELTTPVMAPRTGSPHDSGSGSDYITSSEAQQYSKTLGITPGTPV